MWIPRNRAYGTQQRATWGSTSVGQEAEGVMRNMDKSLHCGLHWKERARQGEADIGLTDLKDFSSSGLLELSSIIWYLALGD